MMASYVVIAFGSFLLISGLMIIKNKKYTQEEGLPWMPFGNIFKGNFAIVFGYFMTAMAVMLILAGLIFIMKKIIIKQ